MTVAVVASTSMALIGRHETSTARLVAEVAPFVVVVVRSAGALVVIGPLSSLVLHILEREILV